MTEFTPTTYFDEADTDTIADFDLSAWIAGMTRVRRAVTIFKDLGANAEIDVLRQRIATAKLAGDNPDTIAELENDMRDVINAIRESALEIVVEGRTAEWLARANDKLKNEGIEDETERAYHIIADAIVIPEGFTPEMVKTIHECSPAQYQAIVTAFNEANVQGAATAPFSPES